MLLPHQRVTLESVSNEAPPCPTNEIATIEEFRAPRFAPVSPSGLTAVIAESGPTVFAHACRLGAEGIVSKKADGAYQSGPCRVWIKVRNPASIAVQRERSEIWNG
jgi:hypothetical protein